MLGYPKPLLRCNLADYLKRELAMKIGLDMLLWTPHVTEEHFPLFDKLKSIGYDGVEIPIFGGDVSHYENIGKVLSSSDLGCTVVSVIPDEEHNPISPATSNRQGAVEYFKGILDCCAVLNAEVLCGPLYQPLGMFSGKGPTNEEKKRAVEVHQQAAEYAGQYNINIAIEALNRFECYFLNTLGCAAEHARKVNHPNFGIMYDTFHGNIEEKDPVGCITGNIDMLKHVHISSNDRGTPGKGHIPWAETFNVLKHGGYDQWLTIEAFGTDMPDDLAATTRVWRDLSANPDEVCQVGYDTIRNGWDTVE